MVTVHLRASESPRRYGPADLLIRHVAVPSSIGRSWSPMQARYGTALRMEGYKADRVRRQSTARNPRWEPGIHGDDPRSPANRGWGWEWTPDPRRIGDGDGDGPPIPGKSGMGVGMDRAPIVGVCRAAALNGQQNEPTPSFSGCHHPRKQGPKKTQRCPSGFGLGC